MFIKFSSISLLLAFPLLFMLQLLSAFFVSLFYSFFLFTFFLSYAADCVFILEFHFSILRAAAALLHHSLSLYLGNSIKFHDNGARITRTIASDCGGKRASRFAREEGTIDY